MNDLPLCPFCGKEVKHDIPIYKQDGRGWRSTYCTNCGASGPSDMLCERADEKWKNRPLEDALNTRIAELEADNKRIKMQLADCECALDELTDPYFDIGVFLVTGKVKTAHYILTYGLTLGREPVGLLIKKDFAK